MILSWKSYPTPAHISFSGSAPHRASCGVFSACFVMEIITHPRTHSSLIFCKKLHPMYIPCRGVFIGPSWPGCPQRLRIQRYKCTKAQMSSCNSDLCSRVANPLPCRLHSNTNPFCKDQVMVLQVHHSVKNMQIYIRGDASSFASPQCAVAVNCGKQKNYKKLPRVHKVWQVNHWKLSLDNMPVVLNPPRLERENGLLK